MTVKSLGNSEGVEDEPHMHVLLYPWRAFLSFSEVLGSHLNLKIPKANSRAMFSVWSKDKTHVWAQYHSSLSIYPCKLGS